MKVEFTLPGLAVDLLREGSPDDDVAREAEYATARRVGRGRSYFFSIRLDCAQRMADYLESVAGVVGDMTAEERAGGNEHRTAAEAVRRIDAAIAGFRADQRRRVLAAEPGGTLDVGTATLRPPDGLDS